MENLTRAQVIVALAAIGLAFIVLDLVRRRKLAEEYSLLWVVASVVFALLGVSPSLLTGLTRTLGILYESSLVFFVGVAFGTAMLLYVSVRLSRLGRHLEIALREVSLLRHELDEVRSSSGSAQDRGLRT